MPTFPRLPPMPVAMLTGTLLCVSACADAVPEPRVTAAPIVLDPPASKPPSRVARVRRSAPGCPAGRVELSQERKQALFQQFDAALGPEAVVPAPAPMLPVPVPDCAQVAR